MNIPPLNRSQISNIKLPLALVLCVTMLGCAHPLGSDFDAGVSGRPSDWHEVVVPNHFENIQRLGHWIGGTKALGPHHSPASGFRPVSADQFGTGGVTTDVRVLVHGWAPGYLKAVTRAQRKIHWWSTSAVSDRTWASDWAWTRSAHAHLPISDTGLFQQLSNAPGNPIVLGYSWIDDSATPPLTDLEDLGPTDVYQSAAHTNANGLRLANALDEALAPEFWDNPKNRLHLIGHSHGSKVATVAALLLQQRHADRKKRGADHLTILDSPESEVTLIANGANLIGYYLQHLDIALPSSPADHPDLFVDTIVSYFGAAYFKHGTPLDRVLKTMLDPEVFSDWPSPSFGHSYSAEWYAGARAGAAGTNLPELGLAWPPVPDRYRPTHARPILNQRFFADASITQINQWTLDGSSIGDSGGAVFNLGSTPMKVHDQTGVSSGNVTFRNNTLTLRASLMGLRRDALFKGAYSNSVLDDNYGVGFLLDWNQAHDDDRLVIAVDSPVESNGPESVKEVILVIDGKSLGGHDLVGMPVSFNAHAYSGPFRYVQFDVYYLPAPGNLHGAVTMREFTLIGSSAP